jgi:uncharacterized protein YjbI with pentapeptide repeats
MIPTSEKSCRLSLAVGRKVFRLGLPALLAVTFLTVAAGAPATARTPRIKKPGPPTAVVAYPVPGGALVSWSPPESDGGSAITGYTVFAPRAGVTCSTAPETTSCMLTGLNNGMNYKVHVKASNVIGLGMSSPRVSVTPESSDCSFIGPSADLNGCDLQDANLTGADLANASLIDTQMVGADLNGANFNGADLYGANLGATNLTNTSFTGANFTEVSSFGGGILGNPASLPDNWSLVTGEARYLIGPEGDLEGAELQGASLNGADLSGIDLSGASLSGIQLTGADLTDANFSGASFTGYEPEPPGPPLAVSFANLNDADLTGADLSNIDFSGIEGNLQGANLSDVNFAGADLTGVYLAGVSSGGITGSTTLLPQDWVLTDGYLIGPAANLTNADLSGANLTNADLDGADVTGASFTNVTWSNTTCPDGTNSNNDGDTCVNNLG